MQDLLQKLISGLKAHHHFLVIPLGVMSSCATHYAPPMNGKQDLYFAAPEYDSISTSETYVEGNVGAQTEDNKDENLFYIAPGIHKAHAYQFFDLAYGMYGYAGGYEVQAIPEESGVKGFYGIGARGAANFKVRYDNFELKVLGLKAAFSKEFGGYRQFREAYQTPEVDTLWMHNNRVDGSATGR